MIKNTPCGKDHLISSKRTAEEPGQAKRIVSVKKFLEIVPIRREAAYRAFKEGKLPCLHFGKKVLVDIDECMAAMRQGGGK
jgi:hypothetical protein